MKTRFRLTRVLVRDEQTKRQRIGLGSLETTVFEDTCVLPAQTMR